MWKVGSEQQLLPPHNRDNRDNRDPRDPRDPLDPEANSKWLQNIIKITVFRNLVPLELSPTLKKPKENQLSEDLRIMVKIRSDSS